MPLVRLDAEEDPAPNMAPMIDVVLVLTIFFMCATKFSGDERQFDLDLPAVGGGPTATSVRQEIIEVEASGTVRIGGEAVAIDDLPARLAAAREARSDLAVTIRGERAVPHGRMAEIYEACRGAGVTQVAISVQPRADVQRK
jgi:biopolymer transport protein ExbD